MGRTIMIGICDDECCWQEHLLSYCQAYFKEQICKVEYRLFGTGKQVLECKDKLDILFLDQYLGRETGIEIKDELEQSFSRTMIVFYICREEITQIMVKAFGWNVMGILCKPVDKAEFLVLMDRMLRKIVNISCIQSFDVNKGRIQIPCRDISAIAAEDCYSRIMMQDGREILLRKTLSDIERENEYPYLVRIHRSFIVNFWTDCKIVQNGNFVRMTDTWIFPIAKRRKREIQNIYVKIQNDKTDIDDM